MQSGRQGDIVKAILRGDFIRGRGNLSRLGGILKSRKGII